MTFPGSSASSEQSFESRTAVDLEAQSTIEKPLIVVNENTRKAIGDKTAFILLKDNIIDTTLVCDTLNVQYDIKTTGKWFHRQQITLITRTDAKNEKSVLVAEWERNWMNDRVRLPKSVSNEFMPAGHILRRVYQWKFPYFFQIKLAFQANGKVYFWNSLPCSLKLYTEDDCDYTSPIVTYSRSHAFRRKRSAFLALSSLYDNSMLDDIIVTWSLTSRRRHKNAMVFHIVKFFLFDFLLFFLIEFYTSKK